MINKQFLLVIYCFLIVSPIQSAAINIDHDYLKNFVHSFIENNLDRPEKGVVDISVSKIDSRINIQPCSKPLLANIPENHNSRNLNVKIVCPDATNWQLFVPVKIQIKSPVLVASTSLSKGTTLTESNTETKLISLHRLRGAYLEDADSVLGAKITRRISAGNVISPRNVCVVCKGDNVTIVAKSGGLMIKTEGLALKNGGLGEQISVQNIRSKRKVLARVETINQVVINL